MAQDPIGTATGATPFQVAQFCLHATQGLTGILFILLRNARGGCCVDFRVSQQMLNDEQVFDGKDAAAVCFFSDEHPERRGQVG